MVVFFTLSRKPMYLFSVFSADREKKRIVPLNRQSPPIKEVYSTRNVTQKRQHRERERDLYKKVKKMNLSLSCLVTLCSHNRGSKDVDHLRKILVKIIFLYKIRYLCCRHQVKFLPKATSLYDTATQPQRTTTKPKSFTSPSCSTAAPSVIKSGKIMSAVLYGGAT